MKAEDVTDDQFDRTLADIIEAMSAAEILATDGAYEVFSEALNNEVLSRLENEPEYEADDDDGPSMADQEAGEPQEGGHGANDPMPWNGR